jgi:hypothetical protein
MDRDKFLNLVRRWMRRVDVRTLTPRAPEITAHESNRFQMSISYWADVNAPDYAGMILSRWNITFVRERDGWRILTIEPTMINHQTVKGWRGLPQP